MNRNKRLGIQRRYRMVTIASARVSGLIVKLFPLQDHSHTRQLIGIAALIHRGH